MGVRIGLYTNAIGLLLVKFRIRFLHIQAQPHAHVHDDFYLIAWTVLLAACIETLDDRPCPRRGSCQG
jgi:hypothetical protein